MAYRRDCWVPNDCILVEIDETKWTTFDFIRNDVLQNFSFQFFKYLAENYENLKLWETMKVVIFRSPNRYVLHCHGECDVFTLYLKGCGMKNSEFLEKNEFYTCTL